MKKKIFQTVFIVILAMMISNLTKAQTNGSWVLPFDHNSNYEADRLQFGQTIQPNYLQDISSGGDIRFSAGGYDENGILLFYVLDFDVYDANSIYVDQFNSAGSSVTQPEIQIIRKPESNNVFYIVYSYHDISSGGVEAFRYTEVTVDINTGQVSLTYFGEMDYYYNQANGGAFAVTRIVDDERKLYRCTHNGITETLINSSGFGGNVTQLLSPYDPTIGAINNFMAYNLEMKTNDDCETTFAWFTRYVYGTDYDHVFIYNMDDDDVLKIDVDESSNGKICGIEFSSRKTEGVAYDILYVSYKSDIPSRSGIIMIDYSNPNNITRQNITSQNNGFSHTFLQHAPDGDIYGVSNDGVYLGKIDEQTGQFTPDYFTYGEVVSFMDVYGYDIYILPENENILTGGVSLDFTIETGGLECECPTNDPVGWAQVQNINGCQDEGPYYYTWYDDGNGNGNVIQEGTGLDYMDNLGLGIYSVCVEDAGLPPATTCHNFEITLDPDLYNQDFMKQIYPNTTDWDNITTYTFREGIYVHANANFTISNSYLQFGPNAKIIVEPTATLTIENSTLTYVQQCPCMWQGIEVWGNPQMDQYEHDGINAQGKLILENSTIENAEIAVQLSKAGTWHTHTGGIVYATNTTFSNNGKALLALYYANHDPVYGVEVDNVGYFNNCTFEITSSYIPDVEFFKHIDMNTVDGFKYKGCDFSLQAGVTGTSQWNQAIAAYSSGFDVKAICTSNVQPCNEWDKCTFSGFRKAINVQNTTSVYTFYVDRAEFTNNEIGIYASNVQNLSVLFSKFNIAKNTSDVGVCESKGQKSSGYGIDLSHCTGFAIEGNHFAPASTGGYYTGIRIAETQATDEVYNNTFEGLSYGNYAVGKNWEPPYNYDKGLAYFCNENTGNWEDITVVKNTGNIGGIQDPIGGVEMPAGNTFTTNANYNINNDGNYWIGYYYYAPTPGNINTPYYPDEVYQVTREEVVGIQNQCLSHYGGGGIGIGTDRNMVLTPEEKQQAEQDFAANLTDYNNVKALYDNLKDGGNTDATLSDVETAWPTDTWQLRSELLGKSPHLSMDVLKAAADKTEVLPESIIFEIMAANPDELKKEELIKYLEDKENPLPDYMIDILKQVAMGTTYKTVLQMHMAHHNQAKTRAAHDIIRSILNDSVVDYAELRNWLDNVGGKRADEQIIAAYMQEGNTADAMALANMMPTLYSYTDDELTEHNHYTEMLNLQIALANDDRTIFDLNSTEVSNLVLIADNSNGTASAQAKGILEFAYDYHYCDCMDVDTSGYKSSSNINYDAFNYVFGAKVDVKPNPAKDWAAFNFTLPDIDSEGVITISDVSGKLIASLQITGKQGQKIWDTRKIKSGVYFYTLNASGFNKSGKIVVSK